MDLLFIFAALLRSSVALYNYSQLLRVFLQFNFITRATLDSAGTSCRRMSICPSVI